MKTIVLAAAIAAALASLAPAYADNEISYVSSSPTTGSDFHTCDFDNPCNTLSRAVDLTIPGGEIRCLNPGAVALSGGGAPTVTISKSLTIDCEGIGESVRRLDVAGRSTGFVINGAGIVVILRGLNLNGSAQPGVGNAARIGIDIQQAASVLIEKCNVLGFTSGAGQGIRLATSSGATNLTVIDSVITNNITGIRVLPSGGAALVSLQRVHTDGNSSSGFEATSAAGGTVFGNIADSTSIGNGVSGVSALSFSGGKGVVLDVQRSNASLNAQSGILADGPASRITIGGSTVTSNGTGLGRTNGGTILSYGDNRVDNNSVDGSPSGSASTK